MFQFYDSQSLESLAVMADLLSTEISIEMKNITIVFGVFILRFGALTYSQCLGICDYFLQ
tara:strand:+ start:1531 stop:1710 length:180 start_codon:yes stop_codon:yes gene_type:complete